jgi:predicted RNase H-like nuclease (RuvC/YqgF family)
VSVLRSYWQPLAYMATVHRFAPRIESLEARVTRLRAELAEAEAQLREMKEGERLEALVKIRNLMRAFEWTPTDLGLTPALKHRGRPRKSVP